MSLKEINSVKVVVDEILTNSNSSSRISTLERKASNSEIPPQKDTKTNSVHFKDDDEVFQFDETIPTKNHFVDGTMN
jgi:hypothetical protein